MFECYVESTSNVISLLNCPTSRPTMESVTPPFQMLHLYSLRFCWNYNEETTKSSWPLINQCKSGKGSSHINRTGLLMHDKVQSPGAACWPSWWSDIQSLNTPSNTSSWFFSPLHVEYTGYNVWIRQFHGSFDGTMPAVSQCFQSLSCSWAKHIPEPYIHEYQ